MTAASSPAHDAERIRFSRRLAAKSGLQAIEADRIIAAIKVIIPIAEVTAVADTHNDNDERFCEALLTIPPLIEQAHDYLLLTTRMNDSRRQVEGRQVLADLANGMAHLVGLHARSSWHDDDLVDLVSKLI